MSVAESLILRMVATGGPAAAAEVGAVKTEVAGLTTETRASGVASERAAAKTSMFSRATGGLAGSLKGVLGAAGLAGLAFGLKDVFQIGQRWQNQTTQMGTTLKTLGLQGHDSLKKIIDSAETLSTHGGFVGEEQMQGMNQFLRLTHSVKQSIDLNKGATDLARGAGLSFSMTQRMMGQVMTGNVGRLQRYLGIIQPITKNYDALKKNHAAELYALQQEAKTMGAAGPIWLHQQELRHGLGTAQVNHAKLLDREATAQNVLARIQKRYGGDTQTFSRTAAGAWSNLKNQMDIFAKTLSVFVMPFLTKLFQVLAWIAHSLISVAEWVGKNSALFKPMAIAVGLVVTAILAYKGALYLAYAAQAGFNLIMEANPIMLVVTAIAALIFAFTVAYHKIKWFRDVVDAVWGWMKGAVVDTVHFIVGVLTHIFHFVTGMPGKIAHAASNMWEGLKGDLTSVINWIIDRLNNLIDGYNSVVGSIPILGGSLTIGHIGHVGGDAPSSGGPHHLTHGGGLWGHGLHAAGASGPIVKGHLAQGGPAWSSGFYDVGEHGPERVFLPQGASVAPHGDLAAGDNTYHLYLVVDGQVIARAMTRASAKAKAVR